MTDVLVVDDNGAIRATVRAILEFAGYSVCEASDGQLALEHLRTHPCGHVILLDFEMPHLNGAQTLEALASQPAQAMRYPIIMITASRLELPPDFAHVPVVSKPFDIDVLLTHVECAARRLASPVSTKVSTKETTSPSPSLCGPSCASTPRGGDFDSFFTASQTS